MEQQQHRATEQPACVHATPIDRLIRIAEVEQQIGRKKSWIYNAVACRRFPLPVDGLWSEREVQGWIAQRLSERKAG